MFMGMVPQADFIPDWINRDSHGYLITNVRCETCCPGVYAVGDLRNTPLRQVVTAAADGAIAATGVEHYLQEKADIAALLSADSGAMTVLFWDPYSSAQQAQLPAIEQALQAQSQVRRIDVTRHDLLFRQLELSATPALARYQNGTLLECKTIPLNTQA